MKHWWRTAGEGVAIAVVAWFVVFLVHLIWEPYHLQADLAANRSQLQKAYDQQGREYSFCKSDLGKRNGETDQLIAQLRQEVEASKQPEAPDSLRKRTFKVADDFTAFLIEKQNNKPPDASPSSADPNPSEERKKEIERSQAFYRGIEDYYFKNFKARFVGIIKEYNSKGVRTGYLEPDFTQRVPYIPAPGSVMDGIDKLSLFRDLAYHVDARDHLIVF